MYFHGDPYSDQMPWSLQPVSSALGLRPVLSNGTLGLWTLVSPALNLQPMFPTLGPLTDKFYPP
jgi:hypothetical protein